MNKEEFIIEQMELSKEDIIANYWYTYQDNIERLGIEHQLELKDKEIERLNSIIKEVREYIGIDEELRKLCTNYDVNGIGILEILDKVSKNENNRFIK